MKAFLLNTPKDDWVERFDGKCDVCQKPKAIQEVTPGVWFGWRVGYICENCKKEKAH
jgi:hypothetical protein